MKSYASVKAIVELLLAELGQLAHMYISVEGMVSIQAIPVLRSVVITLQDRIRMPTLAIQVCVIGRVATSFGISLLGLQPFVGLTVGRIEQCPWSLEGLMSGGSPFSLNDPMTTFHPGCAFWISVLPYLLLEAILEVSIRASLLRLKPVEASP